MAHAASGHDPARVADGLRGRCLRRDDRLDDGRVRRSTPARPSASSRCAPARRSPAASSGPCSSGPVARAFGTETLIVLEALLLGGRRRARRGDRPDDDGPGAAPAARPLDRGRSSARVRHGRALAAHATRRDRLRPAGDPGLLGDVPVPAGGLGDVPTEADLATALGLLSAAVTATSFVVSLVLANRVYARFGVAGAALLLPLVYLGGFGLWLVAFSFSTAALFRFTQQVTQRGVSNAAWSAFYNVVPTGASRPGPGVQRRRARARSGRSCPASCCSPPARSSRATRCSGSGALTALAVHARRGRHPATLRRERPRQPARRARRAGPRGRPGSGRR